MNARKYAFMVGILEPGRERGFTLANDNDASDPAPPTLALNPYREGR